MAKRRRPRKGAGNRSLQIGKRKENFFSEDLQRIRQTVIGLNCRERCRLDSKKSILMGQTGRRWTGAAGDREHVWQGLGRSGSGAQERAARANEDFSDPLCQDSGPSVGPEHGWDAVVSGTAGMRLVVSARGWDVVFSHGWGGISATLEKIHWEHTEIR